MAIITSKKVKIFKGDSKTVLENKIKDFKGNHDVIEIKEAGSNIAFVFYLEDEIKEGQVKTLKRIMIMKSTLNNSWYQNHVGEKFAVLAEDSCSFQVKLKNGKASILRTDAIVI